MRHFWVITASLLLFSSLFLGCHKAPKRDDGDAQIVVPIDPNVKVAPPVVGQGSNDKPGKPPVVDFSKQEKYETALANALMALAEQKYKDALASFEKARSIQDNAFVQGEIAKLKLRMSQDGAAKATANNIETVLNDGKAEDAAKLAKDAVKEFGDGDNADKLVELSVQAEALKNVDSNETKDARYARCKKEGEAAIEAKNLRAAALAFEQALLAHEDAALQKTYDDIRGKLDTYDTMRKKAAELRKDPAHIDDAIAALKEAAAAWDTPPIRQLIDEYQLAKANKRDAISVVDFEVRGDVGLAGVGAAVGDQLQPLLRRKYDTFGRAQLNKILLDLQVGPGFADDPKQQAQVGKVANVRYLVFGSVSRLAGISVRAQLVDVQTGLVVQTGRVFANTVDEAVALLPDLAAQLLMSDDDKMKADQAKQNAAAPVPVVADDAKVPAAPDAKAPLPLPNMNAPAPAVAGLKPDAMKFQAAPADGGLPPPPTPPDGGLRNRMLVASIQLGDYYFQAGQFAAAQQQYMFALGFDPGNWDVRQRLTNVAPLVPPTSTIAPFQALQPMYVRPRIAVMPFVTMGDPSFVPPSLSWWTPANLSPYFTSRFDVADPNLMNWYMARVGLSMNDLFANPNALRWLGQAMGVRYFVFGNQMPNPVAGFDVNAFMVDATTGYQQSAANINVQSTYELKLRLPELAMLIMMTPAQQAAYNLQRTPFGMAVNQGLLDMNQGRYQQAVIDFGLALAMWPDNVQVQFYLVQAQRMAHTQTWQNGQNGQQALMQQAALAATRMRQLQLAQASRQAMVQAVEYHQSLTPSQRAARDNVRVAAQKQLLAQGQAALQSKQPNASVGLLQGAAALTPSTQGPQQMAIAQALASARQAVRRADEVRVDQFMAGRESSRAGERDQQYQRARQQIGQDQKANQTALNTFAAAQADRNESGYRAMKSHGIQMLGQGKFDGALAAFQNAQRFKPTDEMRAMINDAAQRQVIAQAKSPQQKQAIEQKFTAEANHHVQIDAAAKQKDGLYKTALQEAQQALAQKKYDTAQAKFQEAGKHFQTDAVATGLQQVDAGRAALVHQTGQQADTQKKNLAAQKQSDYQAALSAGQKSLHAKDHAAAITSAQHALQIMPNDPQAAQLLQQAQQAKQAHDQADKAQAGIKLALDAGQNAMAAKNYQAAIRAYKEAQALSPDDPAIQQHLKQAKQALAETQAAAGYQKAMNAGDAAMSFKRYEVAAGAFKDALRWMPNDKAATQKLRAAETASAAKTKAPAAVNPPAASAYDQSMQKGATAEKNQRHADAAKAFTDALKARPKDREAQAGLSRSQFNTYMAQGQQYLETRMWLQAQAQFEAALRIVPGDPNATKLLQKAKNKGN